MATIGERVKARRNELKMSQQELALLLGYKSSTSIARIESNERNLPQNKIEKIAEALHTTPEYIMGWEEKQQEAKIVGHKIKIIKHDSIITEFDTSKLVEAINKILATLNEPARKKVLNYAEDLQENRKNLREFVEKLQKHHNKFK